MLPKMLEPSHSTASCGGTITSRLPKTARTSMVTVFAAKRASRKSMTLEPNTADTEMRSGATHAPRRSTLPKKAMMRRRVACASSAASTASGTSAVDLPGAVAGRSATSASSSATVAAPCARATRSSN